VPSFTTVPAGTLINGGAFVVPEALGNKIIHPYSDFLLHDIETGDGIAQTPPQDTADKLRTAALSVTDDLHDLPVDLGHTRIGRRAPARLSCHGHRCSISLWLKRGSAGRAHLGRDRFLPRAGGNGAERWNKPSRLRY
jgi:hypothetical protein